MAALRPESLVQNGSNIVQTSIKKQSNIGCVFEVDPDFVFFPIFYVKMVSTSSRVGTNIDSNTASCRKSEISLPCRKTNDMLMILEVRGRHVEGQSDQEPINKNKKNYGV